MRLYSVLSAILMIFLSVTAMASSSWHHGYEQTDFPPNCNDMEYTRECSCDSSRPDYLFIHAKATQKPRRCNELTSDYESDDAHHAVDRYVVCLQSFLDKLEECNKWSCGEMHRQLRVRHGPDYCKQVYGDHCPDGSDCYDSDDIW